MAIKPEHKKEIYVLQFKPKESRTWRVTTLGSIASLKAIIEETTKAREGAPELKRLSKVDPVSGEWEELSLDVLK